MAPEGLERTLTAVPAASLSWRCCREPFSSPAARSRVSLWQRYHRAMPANQVRDLHDAVARSDDPVVASTRPARTTSAELRRMVEDVLAKLRPCGMRVIELGCGTGVLGVPVSERASSYVGVDVSPEAAAVLRERLPTALVRCANVTSDDLSDLGTFDRVLAYAAIHYVADEDEGERFVRTVIGLLRPAGVALIGNVPLPPDDLPHSLVQRMSGVAWSVRRRLRPAPRRTDAPAMPAGSYLPLTRAMIDGWLARIPGVAWRWVAPRPGIPLQRTRADLIIVKTANLSSQTGGGCR